MYDTVFDDIEELMHSHKLKKTKRSYSDVANDADESTGILLKNYLLGSL